jgi:hypothetical protein
VSGQLLAPAALPPRERASSTHWIEGWVDPRAGLDNMQKWKFLILLGFELRPLGRPARIQSLYRLCYPDSTELPFFSKFHCSHAYSSHVKHDTVVKRQWKHRCRLGTIHIVYIRHLYLAAHLIWMIRALSDKWTTVQSAVHFCFHCLGSRLATSFIWGAESRYGAVAFYARDPFLKTSHNSRQVSS